MGLSNTIAISFKNTDEDMELKEWIESHSNKSGFAKDILRNAMKAEQSGIQQQKPNSLLQKEVINDLVDLVDF